MNIQWQTLRRGVNVARNMGWRYMAFRSVYELQRKSGRLKKNFPQAPPFRRYLSLEEWKALPVRFFFRDREDITVPKQRLPSLAERYQQIRRGQFTFFSGPVLDLSADGNWLRNPDTGYEYDADQHWTLINDYSREAGDIKFVWEKARFAYLYDIIRYDYHFGEDCAAYVFDEILSWINANKVNCGPHYKCSQEISLRVLNWTFALFYYRNSPVLTPEVFDRIQYAIYWQLHHVYENIHFSRIAVRNNHAITETLALYLGGLLYPSLPGAAKWKTAGRYWFEEEVAYQVYADGSFLQFSTNYHRVVVQLLTWALRLAALNGEQWAAVIKEQARLSVIFLRACMHDHNGWLPNYGANDGALFFRLNEQHYRDYRPQLQALAALLKMDLGFPEQYEDMYWYGESNGSRVAPALEPGKACYAFPAGGYYVCREPETLTFLRCGNHRDRPSQADNLHLDIWHKGENLLLDAGSYKYNTDEATLRYFMGTTSHNTVMLGDYDQMEKGPRFIWYNWTQCEGATLYETAEEYIWEGTITAFRQVARNIRHFRRVRKKKDAPLWIVEDQLINKPAAMLMHQLWHTAAPERLQWHCRDKAGNILQALERPGRHAPLYGIMEESREIIFTTAGDKITTEISIKESI
ncbi:alginate lyase family protein [Chitinophaga japonensis]|uniref:Heparinase II/III-like protein n=1 Tax=Chitinophaga japonensis TaxID=104662 RepID=A0A562T068_CHIJA|nr:alginate lyase family protein [Chitinophaga japonensis]TWI86929.1 heparinase II/III-like protein [Chitinophaga japonensis]